MATKLRCWKCHKYYDSDVALVNNHVGSCSYDCHYIVMEKSKKRDERWKEYIRKRRETPQQKSPKAMRRDEQVKNLGGEPNSMTTSEKKEFIKLAMKKNRKPPRKTRLQKKLEQKKRRSEYRAKSDAFLKSQEWKRLRFEVFKKYGRICQCCGARPPGVILHVDHIKPRYFYPELALDINNLQILCAACNEGKGARYTDDFRNLEQVKLI